jgi:hypothetical protein
MVATVVSNASVQVNATGAYSGRNLDRNTDGTIWTCVGWAGSVLELYYSKDGGATWTYAGAGSDVAAAGGGANGRSLFIDLDDYAHLVYKDSSSGNISYLRGTPNAGRTSWTWSTAYDCSSVSGAVYSFFPDVVAHRDVSGGGWTAHVVCSDANGGSALTRYARIAITSTGTITATKFNDQVNYGGGAQAWPSVDFHHTGDGKTVKGGTPHVFIFSSNPSATRTMLTKYSYATGSWTQGSFSSPDLVHYFQPTSGPGAWAQMFFDGTRVVCAGAFLNAGAYDLMIFERDVPDTTWTVRTLASNIGTTTGAIKCGSATFDVSSNVYLLGYDGSTPPQTVYRKWVRGTSTLSSTTVIDSTDAGAGPVISTRRACGNYARLDAVGTKGASPYTVVSQTVDLNTAPSAPTGLGPTGGLTIDRTVAQTFSWTFNDSDLADSQSAATLQYRIVGAGTWTTVTTGATPSYTFAPNALAAGDYEWQVQTTDNHAALSPFSASSFFTAANPPASPTITAPASGGSVSTTASLTWTASSQDAYEARTVADAGGIPDTATVYTTSGIVIDSSGRSRTVSYAVNGRYEHTQLRVRVTGLWSAWSSVRVLVSFTPPAVPVLTVTPNVTIGTVAVTVVNPSPTGGQPTVTSWDTYRRVGPSGTAIRIAKGLNGAWTDYTPADGVDYRYLVRAIGTSGATTDSTWST